jgi:hypothetical protein
MKRSGTLRYAQKCQQTVRNGQELPEMVNGQERSSRNVVTLWKEKSIMVTVRLFVPKRYCVKNRQFTASLKVEKYILKNYKNHQTTAIIEYFDT